MDTRQFHHTLGSHGLDREVSDAIVDLVTESRRDLVTNDKLELELTKLRSELRGEMTELRSDLREEMMELRSELRTDMAKLRGDVRADISGLLTAFAEHKLTTTRLVLGTSGALGVLMVLLRFYPVA